MSNSIPPSPAPPPALDPEPSPEHGGARRVFDTTAMIIIAGFACLAFSVVGMMYDGYRRNRVTSNSDFYYNNRQYAKAIPYLQEIVKKFPDAWMRMKMLGDCYLLSIDHNNTQKAQENARLARECYQRVLDSPVYKSALTDPATPADARLDMDLNEELGICASELNDVNAAQAYFQKVMAQEPDSPAANFYQGVQYFKAGSYRQAARNFQNAANGDQHLTVDEKDLEAPRPSRWGDRWDKLSEPYRKEIAKRVLEAPLTPVPAPATEKKAGSKG